MKLKIKVKVLTPGCEPQLNAKGDWIDLKAAEDMILPPPFANALHKHKGEKQRTVETSSTKIPLGVAMQLPKGFEAVVLPRSSSFASFGFIMTNSTGVIDNSYSGDNDEWKIPVLAVNGLNVRKYDRIAQFRIQPSQKASFWQKLKGLFSKGISLEFVHTLNTPDRGGFGSTGVQ